MLWKDKGETRTEGFNRERDRKDEQRRECGEGQLTLKATEKSRRNLLLWKRPKRYAYVKGNLSDSPNHRETMPELDILSHKVKPPVPRMAYILFIFWPKVSHRTPSNITGWDQGHWLFSTT